MDAITMLRNDHASVEKQFKAFEKAGERAHAAKRRIVDSIVRELSVHAAIEEQVFYPAVQLGAEKARGMVLESLEEHHIVKWLLSELDGMSPEEERFDAKVTVLIENVRHHVKEEEQELFPRVREVMSRSELTELGERLAAAKRVAPTHPHPRQPDTPPANLVAGVIGATTDIARDLIRSATGKPTGSAGATRTARAAARSATRTARSGADNVKRAATKAAKKAAKQTSKRTSGVAKAAKAARGRSSS